MRSDHVSTPSASSKARRFLPCWHGVLLMCAFCGAMILTFPPFWGCFSEDGYRLKGTNALCHKDEYLKLLPPFLVRKGTTEGASRAAEVLEGQDGGSSRELRQQEHNGGSVLEGDRVVERVDDAVSSLGDLLVSLRRGETAGTFEKSPENASEESSSASAGQEAKWGDPPKGAGSLPAMGLKEPALKGAPGMHNASDISAVGGSELAPKSNSFNDTLSQEDSQVNEVTAEGVGTGRTGTKKRNGAQSVQDEGPSYGQREQLLLSQALEEAALDSAEGDSGDSEEAPNQDDSAGSGAGQQPKAVSHEDNRPHPSCQPKDLIYVYDLPPYFHEDLFNGTCGASNFWSQHPRNACVIYSPEHGGIGPRLTGEEVTFLDQVGSPVESWADTGQFALEVMFHQYMRDSYPCRTFKGDEAAAFYVPLYAGMLHHNRTLHCRIDTCQEGFSPLGWLGRLLGAQLNKQRYLRRHGGRDHIMTMGHVTFDGLQDDTCCGNGLLKTKHTKRFVIMGIESSVYASLERQVSIPYPTCFHPGTPDDVAVHRQLMLSSERPVLASFAGQLDRVGLQWGRNLRAKIAEQCALHPGDCDLLECGMECACSHVLALQLRAKFCLQPTGDSPTRRSLFDSLQAGCIPVLFHRSSAYDEYTSFLPPDETSYSVFIPESDVMQHGVDIIETLRAIPEAELERKRKVIASMLPSISYEDHARAREQHGPVADPLGERSAYEVAIAEALRRVQKALEAV